MLRRGQLGSLRNGVVSGLSTGLYCWMIEKLAEAAPRLALVKVRASGPRPRLHVCPIAALCVCPS